MVEPSGEQSLATAMQERISRKAFCSVCENGPWSAIAEQEATLNNSNALDQSRRIDVPCPLADGSHTFWPLATLSQLSALDRVEQLA